MTKLAGLSVALALSVFGVSTANAQSMKITSSDISEGGTIANEQVFKGFGCSGGNVSPALSWSGAPSATKSFAVSIYDPDAPTGSGWWHWVVYNIPAATTQLAEGAGADGGKGLPAGSAMGHTDFGSAAFGGACPPAGDKPHRYVFTVYALKTDKLDIPAGATAALVGFMVHANMIGEAKFTALYGRK